MRMLAWLFLLCWTLSPPLFAQKQVGFDAAFIDSTLRIDLYHTGSAADEFYTVDRISRSASWAGNPRQLIDRLNYGRYRALVYDAASGALLYSRGFNSYFAEYQSTAPAGKGIRRTFFETLSLPYPKKTVRISIEKKDKRENYQEKWTMDLDPADYHILRESSDRGGKVIDTEIHGAPHDCVDLVILAEGYRAEEQQKFEKDLKRFAETLFSMEPYRSNRQHFNLRGVFTPSAESGVDEPRQGIFRSTALDASFNALDTDRYLLPENNKAIQDLAAEVPHDAILVMANSPRYGGGGIYNYFTIFTSDGPWNDYVFHHEFGHAFGGLGDEYYTRDVAYEETYPPGVEPNEPNVTALLDPTNLKWKDLVTPGFPIPTPWGQQEYDSLGTLRDSLASSQAATLAALERSGTPRAEVDSTRARISRQMAEVNRRLHRFFMDHPLRGKVGAFEGANYLPKGFYRPTLNSIMNQFNEKERTFYPVDERAIQKVIDTYTK